MKLIIMGHRTEGKAQVHVFDGQRLLPLDCRNDLRNHSPAGPEWGYGGSGPSQLALGLLCLVLQDEEEAMRYYQDFKFQVVASMVRETGWVMSDECVKRWHQAARQGRRAPVRVANVALAEMEELEGPG